LKGLGSFCSSEVGIASVRRGNHGLHSQRGGKVGEQGKKDKREDIRFHVRDSAPFALHTAMTK